MITKIIDEVDIGEAPSNAAEITKHVLDDLTECYILEVVVERADSNTNKRDLSLYLNHVSTNLDLDPDVVDVPAIVGLNACNVGAVVREHIGNFTVFRTKITKAVGTFLYVWFEIPDFLGEVKLTCWVRENKDDSADAIVANVGTPSDAAATPPSYDGSLIAISKFIASALQNTLLTTLGQNGSEHISDTSEHTGDFTAFQALEDCVIDDMTSADISGTLAGMVIPAGVTVWGRFESITLTSGSGIAYNNIA